MSANIISFSIKFSKIKKIISFFLNFYFKQLSIFLFLFSVNLYGNSIDDSFSNLKKALNKLCFTRLVYILLADEQNNPVIAHNVNKQFNPASIMKLITTSAALDLLGPNYKWETKLLLSDALNKIYW